MWKSVPDCAPPHPSASGQLGRRPCLAALAAGLCWPPAASLAAVGDTLQTLPERCGLPASSVGLYARVVGQAQPLVAINAEQPFQMASTAKLVTSMAALDVLGPEFRWRTAAYLDGELRDGTLWGDLWLVGGGDATLNHDTLQAWMAQWRAQGLHRIQGHLVLDRRAFALTAKDHAFTPTPSASRPHHLWPDALMVDQGRVRVSLKADADGRPLAMLAGAKVGTEFVGQRACQPVPQWARDEGRPQAAPSLQLQGDWTAACGPMSVEAVLPPGQVARLAVAQAWARAGGSLTGSVLDQPAAPRAPKFFSVHQSECLPALLRDINKTSDNLAARHLMLAMSPGFPSQAATLVGAQRRLLQWLAQQGLARGDIEVDSGSGLSRQERAKPRALASLLERFAYHPQGMALLSSLPLAGVDGTMQHRLRGGAAQGQAYLKTGTLLDTRALAGYIKTRSGHVVVVTALINHPQADRATPQMDGCIEWLARHA
jgi:D-alanyl-D-alanine carboxypeptidase/D-alanyl-D-alanine-endopeptidase (penicillin-binding protein 4)